MTFLNAQQLAFILDIKKQDARLKMIYAHCKANGDTIPKGLINQSGKLVESGSDFPEAMPIAMLSKECNLPDLQTCVDDINGNYLKRAASRKWILCDYPEKQILKMEEKGEKRMIRIPAALKSMLPISTVQEIEKEWARRFPAYNGYCEKISS